MTVAMYNINAMFLEYLCCTKCKSDLRLESEKLVCTKCGDSYAISKGIPIMADLQDLPEHLRGQIKYFEGEKITLTNEYKLYPWQQSFLNRFADNFNVTSDTVVVDCGTGSGYMAVELATKSRLVIACDLTLHSLIRLKEITDKKGINNIMYVCCSAEDLPFKTQIADLFISNAVLE